jgi:very-short-patch-repair endonuclease
LVGEVGGGVDVTVVGRNPGFHPGIRLHRPRSLGRQDLTTMRGIRVTSVARTICDLAATEPAREVEVVFQEALYRDVVSERQVRAVLDREPHRRGAPEIRDLLRDPRMTRSEKERALLRLIDAAQLPRPLTNVRVHGYLVDAFWPKEGLVVEVDGWDAHGHRVAFESNRRRDQVLLAHGLRVLRATGRQFEREPVAVAARIAMALKG